MEPPTITELVRAADLEVHDPAFFRDLLKAIKRTGDQADFILDPEGIKVQQMDPSYVCMVQAFIPRDFFDSYNVYEERTISLDIDAFLKQNFRAGKMKDAEILMRIEADRIVSSIKDRGRRVCKNAPLLDPIEASIPTPNIFFNSSVRLVTKTLKGILEDCKMIKSHVLITVEPSKLLFTCEDKEANYLVESVFDKYADDMLDLESEGKQKAIYDVDFLLDLVKGLEPISETVKLEMSNNSPIRITAETKLHDLRLIYYLAPCTDFNEKEPKPEVEAAAPEIVDPHDPQVIPHEDPEPYICEYPECDVEIPEAEGVRLEDGETILCADHAEIVEAEVPVPHEDQPSLGDLYLKYYAEALARNRAEAVL